MNRGRKIYSSMPIKNHFPVCDRKLHEECGIFAVFGTPEAASLTYRGLFALQHRGQESAGIVVSDGRKIRSSKGLGILTDTITARALEELKGHIAIGHVRYSTTGAKKVQNIQPLVLEHCDGLLGIAHNGNLINAYELRKELENQGSIFQTSTDSEMVAHLLARPEYRNYKAPMSRVLGKLHGSYSFVFLQKNRIVAARDPRGFRPLSLGRLESGGWVVSSETCAFDLVNAKFVRDIKPREILEIDDKGLHSMQIEAEDPEHLSQCIFEHIYFARPDSIVFGDQVHEVRKALGRRLAIDAPADADIVIAIPDSGRSSAMGFAEQSGIPLERGFIRNHYVGRTFIMPPEDSRQGIAEIKLNVVKSVVRGKRVVVVDDSVIRGNTSRARIGLLKRAGAKEVHLRISCPPCKYPCFFGIDFPTSEELVASGRTVEEIRKYINVDSLAYQTMEGLLAAVSSGDDYCTACFSNLYPEKPVHDFKKMAFEETREESVE